MIARAGRAVLGAAFLAVTILAIVACAAEPAPTPSPTPSTSVACIGLEAARCQEIIDTMPDELLGGGTPAYIEIREWPCNGPCGGALFAQMAVEFQGNLPPAVIRLNGGPAGIDWEPVEAEMSLVEPDSVELDGAATDLTLGHCGLASGIDVDGAFWDPVGVIDASHGDLINSADARFTLLSPNEATLQTAGGAVVQLVRHQAPKYLFGCD